jgi:hypothetical protein
MLPSGSWLPKSDSILWGSTCATTSAPALLLCIPLSWCLWSCRPKDLLRMFSNIRHWRLHCWLKRIEHTTDRLHCKQSICGTWNRSVLLCWSFCIDVSFVSHEKVEAQTEGLEPLQPIWDAIPILPFELHSQMAGQLSVLIMPPDTPISITDNTVSKLKHQRVHNTSPRFNCTWIVLPTIAGLASIS